MPVSICIEQETGVAIAACSGVLRPDDAREAVALLWKMPGWKGSSVLWDVRSATFDFTAPDVRETAQFILQNQPATPPSKVAFVTQRDVDFGMSRMFGVFRENPATAFRVFRDYDEAIAWARSLEPDTI